MERTEALRIAYRALEREWEYAVNKRDELEDEAFLHDAHGNDSAMLTARYHHRHWKKVADDLLDAQMHLVEMGA